MISNLRRKINWKNSIYKDYLKNGKTNYHYIKLQHGISEISAAISKGKRWLPQTTISEVNPVQVLKPIGLTWKTL